MNLTPERRRLIARAKKLASETECAIDVYDGKLVSLYEVYRLINLGDSYDIVYRDGFVEYGVRNYR